METFECSPYQHAADRQEAERIEEVCESEKSARKADAQGVGEDQEAERDFVRQVVDAVHHEAEALRRNTGADLDGEGTGVERQRGDEWSPSVRHGQLLLYRSLVTEKNARPSDRWRQGRPIERLAVQCPCSTLTEH